MCATATRNNKISTKEQIAESPYSAAKYAHWLMRMTVLAVPTVTVTVPLRAAPVFSLRETTIVSPDSPEDVESEIHDALADAIQFSDA